jgi:hypothetical protein
MRSQAFLTFVTAVFSVCARLHRHHQPRFNRLGNPSAHQHAPRLIDKAAQPDTDAAIATSVPHFISTSHKAHRSQRWKKRDQSGSSPGFASFCNSKAVKRATADQNDYKGKIGSDDNYGCNMMTIDASVSDKYQYTVVFKNAGISDQSCVCFNKTGPDGGVDGFWKGKESITLNIPVSGTQVVAFDQNSQVDCVCGFGNSIPTKTLRQYDHTLLEFDFGNESNDGWSSAGASCRVAAAAGLDIPSLRVCHHHDCSTISPGGSGTNACLGGMEAEDRVGLRIKPGKVRLTVDVDYSG